MPAALDRAIGRAQGARRDGSKVVAIDGMTLLDEITKPMKDNVFTQLIARRHDYFAHTGVDRSRLYKDVLGGFEGRWTDLGSRMALVAGKEVLGLLRNRVQESCGVTLTDARIVEAMTRDDIPDDMCDLLNKLETFRNTKK